MTTLADLKRNDVPAAVAYVEAILDEEQDPTQDDGQTLLMLQDDSAGLVAALEALYQKRAARGLKVPDGWEP